MKTAMYQLGRQCLVLLVVLVLSACGSLQVSPEAEGVISKYFQAIRAHKYDDALLLYSPRFFETTSKDKWRTLLTKVGQKLGDLQSYEIVSWAH